MKRITALSQFGIVTLLFLVAGSLMAIDVPPQPETEKNIVVDTVHGTIIEDPYRWLEDQESPQTRAWIEKQQEYFQDVISKVPGRQDIIDRLTELRRVDKVTMPTKKGDRYFLYKFAADQEHYVIYMREGLFGEDKVLLDPHEMFEDPTKSVGMFDITEDGQIMAYYVRDGGEDETRLYLMDVDSKELLPDSLPRYDYFGFSFTHDGSGFYYSRREENGPRLYYHKLGDDLSEDQLVYGEGMTQDKILSAWVTDNGDYLMVSVYHGSSSKKNELYYKDLRIGGGIRPLVNDIEAVFSGQFAGDKLLIQTNWNAPNWKIMEVDMSNPAPENWTEFLPESDVVLKGFSVAGDKIFVNLSKNVLSNVEIYDIDGNNVGEISFPSLGTVGGVRGRWGVDDAFFSFTSYHIPTTTYHYKVSTGERSVWDRPDVPVNSDDIEAKQVWYISKDGTRIPMFLVYPAAYTPDGETPILLTGYGGFRASMTPYFSSMYVFWVENGGIVAVPSLRGGGEFGEKWHEAGMREKKQSTFDDFIAAAEWLIDNGYTKPEKIAIRGGSNGGLLVGAALAQRPDLFGAVVCTFPLLDMVRFHKFLMGPYWVGEYGSADDPEQFKYIHKYSPYHNIEKGVEYPSTLFITGDYDTRVAPLHARKMTALLQDMTAKPTEDPVFLMYDIKAGHSGGKTVTSSIEDDADMFLYLFWQLGML